MPERSRNGTFVRGFGEGKPAESGRYVFDEKSRKFVRISDRPPPIASRIQIEGMPVICDPAGETLDLGPDGPVRVETAQEKRDYLRSVGCMPHPGGRFGGPTSKPQGGKRQKVKKSFAQHFHEENNIGLREHLDKTYGPDVDLNLEV